VRKVLFSGEVMPEKHLRQWMEKLPEAEFVNLYGPTEITCNCTYHRIDRTREYQGTIPIGRAFPNEEVFLLEGSKKVEEPGQTGEICVSGTALALGYYNAPEQTKKAFVQNPLQDRYPEIIYRTGDLACYNEDGELVFKGRKDFQIKYQGHRIELEEIERAMMQLEEVRRAVCVFDEQKGRLFGFYTGDIEGSILVEALGRTLAVWQIPKLKQVEDMPLTKNGKVDRKLLLASVQRRPRK
ncbi:MAG: AMP-binding protein, partial [Clostridiales bacterium]|nr:AMP-binding protein [Clostridiales bacterium]